MSGRTDKPLHVVGFIATRRGDPDRGPQVSLRPADAAERLIEDGELVYLTGPRRQELAVVRLDEGVSRGGVVLRDIAGVTVSEVVRLVKRR